MIGSTRFQKKLVVLNTALLLVTNTTWSAVSVQSALPAVPAFVGEDTFNIDMNSNRIVVAVTNPDGLRIGLLSTSSLTTYDTLPSPTNPGVPNTDSAPGITIDPDDFISVAYTNYGTDFTSFTIEPNAPVASENSSGLNPTVGEQNLSVLKSDGQGNLVMGFVDSLGGNVQGAVEPANVDNQWETTSTQGANVIPDSLEVAFSENRLFGIAVWIDNSGGMYKVFATKPSTIPSVITDINSLTAQVVYTTTNPQVIARTTVDESGRGTLFIVDSTASANIMYLRADTGGWNLTLNQIPVLSSNNVTALELITANTGIHFGTLITGEGQPTAFCGVPDDSQWFTTALNFNADPAPLALTVEFVRNMASLLIRERVTAVTGNLLYLTWANVALGTKWFTDAEPFKAILSTNSVIGTAIKQGPPTPRGEAGVVSPTAVATAGIITLENTKALSSYLLQVSVLDDIAGVLNLQARQLRTLSCKKLNIISWRSNSKGPAVSAYEIYSDADLTTLVGTVPAKRKCQRKAYVFIDNKKRSKIYYLVTRYVDGSASVSQPVSVEFNCR